MSFTHGDLVKTTYSAT